jgi:hypothetical protein
VGAGRGLTFKREVDILSKKQQQKIVQYLNEAHATELALVRVTMSASTRTVPA